MRSTLLSHLVGPASEAICKGCMRVISSVTFIALEWDVLFVEQPFAGCFAEPVDDAVMQMVCCKHRHHVRREVKLTCVLRPYHPRAVVSDWQESAL